MESYGSTLQTVDLNGNPLPEKLRFFDTAYECKDYAYCVFSSKQTIELIEKEMKAKERNVLMDATFGITPVGPFYQLLVLYIRKHNKVCSLAFICLVFSFRFSFHFYCSILNPFFSFKVFPFAYVLMSRKTQRAYEAVFDYINSHVLQINNIASFTTDYELAMRNALKKLFPNVQRFACYFHFCQAVKRRAYQTDGLVKLIRCNVNAR